MDALRPTMVSLRPFWGRATVLPSPVDEIGRESGLIVPIAAEHNGIERGVVLHVCMEGVMIKSDDTQLREGMVVYFQGGVRIGDVVVVDLEDVIAYMDDEA